MKISAIESSRCTRTRARWRGRPQEQCRSLPSLLCIILRHGAQSPKAPLSCGSPVRRCPGFVREESSEISARALDGDRVAEERGARTPEGGGGDRAAGTEVSLRPASRSETQKSQRL